MIVGSHLHVTSLRDRPITANERAWIEFIRLASHDQDPAPTLKAVQSLREIFSEINDQRNTFHAHLRSFSAS